jgi:nucleoside phosphorylase
MLDCRILILTAVLPEARALARAFRLPEKFAAPVVMRGEVAVGLVGMRCARLGSVDLQAQGIIMAGLAGGLTADLKIGNVVVEGEPWPGQPQGLRFGKIHTAARIIGTPTEKRTLSRETGADVVEMETAPAAAWARERRVAFLAVRAISDTVEEELDPAFARLVDDVGRAHGGRVAALLLRHPGKLRELLKLKHATDMALQKLTATVAAIVASGWPGDKNGSDMASDGAASAGKQAEER